MNSLLNNHISTKGLDGAMNIARALIENGYQVFIQLDDCDIYIVSYQHNDPLLGDDEFAAVTQEELESLIYAREVAENKL